jgi:hypothetical protein
MKNLFSLNPLKGFWIAFLLLHGLLSVYYIDSQITPNPTSRVLPIFTVFHQGTWQIDELKDWSGDKAYVNGHYYSEKAPLPIFLVMPFYGLLKLAGLDQTPPHRYFGFPIQILGGVLVGSLPFVFLLWASLTSLKSWIKTRPLEMLLLGTLPWYGSFVYLYSGTYFNHVLAGAFLVGAQIFLNQKSKRENLFFAGLCVGASVWSEYTVAVFIAVWGLKLVYEKKSQAVFFFAGVLPFIVAAMVYNALTTGNPFQTLNAYHAEPAFAGLSSFYGFRLPSLEALWGLTFSPYRGLFFYAPFALFLIWIAIRNRQNRVGLKILGGWNLAACIHFFVLSTHFTWWGGWCYGPRYLVPSLALFFYNSIGLFPHLRPFDKKDWTAFSILTGFGLFGVILAKATAGYMLPEAFSNPLFQILLPRFLEGKLNNDQLGFYLLGLGPYWALGFWILFFLLSFAILFRLVKNIRI